MTTLREAAQMALEALEQAHDESLDENHFECRQILMGQIIALRAALAEQQEPVAWMWEVKEGSPITKRQGEKRGIYFENPSQFGIDINNPNGHYRWTLLYTAPQPAKQPLTDDRVWLEYMQLWPFRPNEEPTLAKDILRFARAIEAAHGINVPQARGEQE